MFFGIAADSYAKIGWSSIKQVIFKVFTVIHIIDLVYKLTCINIPGLIIRKFFFVAQIITANSQYIFNSQILKLNQCVFSFFACKAEAKNMRNGINMELIFYCNAYADSPRAFTLYPFLNSGWSFPV